MITESKNDTTHRREEKEGEVALLNSINETQKPAFTLTLKYSDYQWSISWNKKKKT